MSLEFKYNFTSIRAYLLQCIYLAQMNLHHPNRFSCSVVPDRGLGDRQCLKLLLQDYQADRGICLENSLTALLVLFFTFMTLSKNSCVSYAEH